MRRWVMVVSGVVAALAVCSVLFAMTREEIAERPLIERTKLEEWCVTEGSGLHF